MTRIVLQRIIASKELWVFSYDVETKTQPSGSKLTHRLRPKKARQVRSNVKALLIVFFDIRGVVHHVFLPQGETVSKEYCLQVMRNLREASRQKRLDLWKNRYSRLHYDNTPSHASYLVRAISAKSNTLRIPKQPFFLDPAPSDFFLFPELNKSMKGRRYATLDETKKASKGELRNE